MSKDNIIEFAEVEYRPRGFRNQAPKFESARLLRKRQHTRVRRPDASEEIEFAHLPTRRRNVLSKAPQMQVMRKIHESDEVEGATRVCVTDFV
jgi:hypothetical protein